MFELVHHFTVLMHHAVVPMPDPAGFSVCVAGSHLKEFLESPAGHAEMSEAGDKAADNAVLQPGKCPGPTGTDVMHYHESFEIYGPGGPPAGPPPTTNS
eukprot:CAMPEP_0206237470 /NCGR_PEP_ID=MMETSP0047_2-20121206/14286_1 /ASSEMBLY_ACC=CAM_ASM_000192 /TAXON_ID=195065 /ORGANISM="Chroomonas mesostigmatica_cf, Strain CCMP1168" /LENGTH=98 /DNA_ID=CAMNT_0053661915 /DNA_START=149 /DNA_END=445 /DNA_ORIENTATION=+